MGIIKQITDVVQGKASLSDKRSSQWPAVRKQHLKDHGSCAVCNSTKKLEVHHIKPFHLHPELELDLNNLITLCEGNGTQCHLMFGHLGNYQSFNKAVVTDAKTWNKKISTRPKKGE